MATADFYATREIFGFDAVFPQNGVAAASVRKFTVVGMPKK
jgi:hypothetical protein